MPGSPRDRPSRTSWRRDVIAESPVGGVVPVCGVVAVLLPGTGNLVGVKSAESTADLTVPIEAWWSYPERDPAARLSSSRREPATVGIRDAVHRRPDAGHTAALRGGGLC